MVLTFTTSGGISSSLAYSRVLISNVPAGWTFETNTPTASLVVGTNVEASVASTTTWDADTRHLEILCSIELAANNVVTVEITGALTPLSVQDSSTSLEVTTFATAEATDIVDTTLVGSVAAITAGLFTSVSWSPTSILSPGPVAAATVDHKLVFTTAGRLGPDDLLVLSFPTGSGWTLENRKTIINQCKTSALARKMANSDDFCICVEEKIQKK